MDDPSRRLRRFAAVATLALAIFLTAYIFLSSGDSGYRYNLVFQSGSQLVNGDQVMIGGAPRGSVTSIERTDDNLARVGIEIEQQLHEGTTAVIRVTSQLGIANRTIHIAPGPNSAPPLHDGDTLGLAATTTPVDIDQVFDAFQPQVRKGLSQFIQGNGNIYAGKGPQANAAYKYFAPALSQATRFTDELNSDRALFRDFIVNSSRLVTTVSQRADNLSSSISNAGTAFSAIGQHSDSVDQAVRILPSFFNQANGTFGELRRTLDRVDPLVETAKPATRDLTPFARHLRPVFKRGVPVFRNLASTVRLTGKANDARELFKSLPKVRKRASGAFPASVDAIHGFQPTLHFARSYFPDVMGTVTKLGQITAPYDANGHYARIGASGLNLFKWNSATSVLEPIPLADQYDAFGSAASLAPLTRCPGGATQSAPDNSNPFVNPPWTESGLTAADCDPGQLPPGP